MICAALLVPMTAAADPVQGAINAILKHYDDAQRCQAAYRIADPSAPVREQMRAGGLHRYRLQSVDISADIATVRDTIETGAVATATAQNVSAVVLAIRQIKAERQRWIEPLVERSFTEK